MKCAAAVYRIELNAGDVQQNAIICAFSGVLYLSVRLRIGFDACARVRMVRACARVVLSPLGLRLLSSLLCSWLPFVSSNQPSAAVCCTTLPK